MRRSISLPLLSSLLLLLSCTHALPEPVRVTVSSCLPGPPPILRPVYPATTCPENTYCLAGEDLRNQIKNEMDKELWIKDVAKLCGVHAER